MVLLTELLDRITFKIEGSQSDFRGFNSILSLLNYMLKAPLVPQGAPLVNALFRQRNAIENTLRACLGLAPESDLMFESRI